MRSSWPVAMDIPVGNGVVTGPSGPTAGALVVMSSTS